MAFISATGRPLYHAAIENNTALAAGITRVGETTISGHELIAAADELEFLALVGTRARGYNPLPTSSRVQAGEIYGHNDGLVIVRETHERTGRTPAQDRDKFWVR